MIRTGGVGGNMRTCVCEENTWGGVWQSASRYCAVLKSAKVLQLQKISVSFLYAWYSLLVSLVPADLNMQINEAGLGARLKNLRSFEVDKVEERVESSLHWDALITTRTTPPQTKGRDSRWATPWIRPTFSDKLCQKRHLFRQTACFNSPN